MNASEPSLRFRHMQPLVARPLMWFTIGAIGLRLILFLGRGHYVAFDEGWYLLLGRNLWAGEGYMLTGLRHLTLSPLFPILAGAMELLIGDIVWAGRIVAALAGGLLVVPCWAIFRRLGGQRLAVVGCVFVALMPSLAPFVVPYWIGWDLWVGAEPLLHLFLFTGFAFFLRAWEEGGLGAAFGCGAAFALAYLSRPEAIIVFGLLAAVAFVLGASALRRRAPLFAICLLAFCLVAAPYWLHLRDGLGRWAISGRGVEMAMPAQGSSSGSAAASSRIEDMLWRDDDSRYIRALYSLDPSATRLASPYWGVRESTAPEQESAPPGERDPGNGQSGGAPAIEEAGGAAIEESGPVDALIRYGRALGVVLPWFMWPFVLLGVLAPGADRRPRLELSIGLPILGTSVLIAAVVATDPRTQLFVAPLAAFYAARGAWLSARWIHTRTQSGLRPSFLTGLIAGVLALLMLGTSARRLYLSLAVGSPHHIVGAENAIVGEALREITPEHATVMSWHPAIALFAERDWRVLPMEPLERILVYAARQPNAYIVLSVFYPPNILQAEEPHYLIVPAPADPPAAEQWRISIFRQNGPYALGRLQAVR